MPWVAWLSTLLAFLGPAAFLAFGRRIRDVTRRGLGRRGGVLLCLRQFVLDSDKLLLQLSDSRRQFIAVLASVRRSGHRDQNLRQSAKCPYTNSQPVNGYGFCYLDLRKTGRLRPVFLVGCHRCYEAGRIVKDSRCAARAAAKDKVPSI